MNVNLKSTWMLHSGDTKYYQVFQLQPTFGGEPVTIVHYGPLRGRVRAASEYRPVLGGQVQLIRGMAMAAKVNAKKPRGYAVTDTKSTTINIGTHFEGGDRKLIEIFGAAHAHSIHQILTAVPDVGVGPSDEGETIPVPGVKPAITALPESWGSW